MPELPEVETLKLGLHKYLVGHKILDVDVQSRRIFRDDENQIIGGKIVDIRRFAKVLSFDLSNGKSFIVHIKLTGQLIYRGPNLKEDIELSKKVAGLPGKSTHVIFKLDRNGTLFYNDFRRFGWIKIVDTKDVETSEFIGKLGPEPLKDLTLENFREIISRSKSPIKVILMDQARIGGVGNIYANDSLWMSKIHPQRPANSLTKTEQKELFKNLVAVLKEGIKYGGASELNFVTAEGTDGGYQNHFRSYGQQNKLCQRCRKAKIEKYFLAGRGTYFCPNCQI